jgi:hypothetical protein|tara:strand:+ start:1427 stop:1666 length:240 start_codon:yes stop_codon:yes gene_type:complete
MRDKIKLEGEIDLTVTPNETRIKPIDGDYWNDFGYWLEATGFMAYQAMKYREWSEEEIIKYSADYIKKCIRDYKIKYAL